jgi:hypothetical protein
MGKQKLTTQHAKLIRHLFYNEGRNCYDIQRETHLSTREHIYRIVKGIRWGEVDTPTSDEGTLLYWKWVNKEI